MAPKAALKDLPNDKESKKARAIARSKAHHAKKAARVKKTKKDILMEEHKAAEKEPSVKKAIKVIKRQGGTLRFAKELSKIRRIKGDAKLATITAKRQAVKDKTVGEGKEGKSVTPRKYKVKKMRAIYHTQLPSISAKPKGYSSKPKRRTFLRKSLVPGTVCIIVAGRHQGKKVVFMKQLRRSGLCLVTGPYKINGIPLRRMDQNYLIATSVRINIPATYKVPAHIDDFFFKQKKTAKKPATKSEDGLFKNKKVSPKKKPNASRKAAQSLVDRIVLKALKTHKEKGNVTKYIKTNFTLIGDRYAHNLNF